MDLKDSRMKNVLVGIVFLLGTFLGMLTATQVGEELMHIVPAKYLTFGRPDDIQAAAKIYKGVPPENGKLVYILGGSSGFTSANEYSLSKQLTEKLGVPVQVYNVSAASQKMIESYSMIDKMLESSEEDQIYIVMTYGGYRAAAAPKSAVRSAFSRTRSPLRHDAVRELIENGNLLEESFMLDAKGNAVTPTEFMAPLDKKYTASVGSHWLKYLMLDKLKKINKKKFRKNFFTDQPAFRENDYSERILNRVRKVFANPKQQKRIQARYTRYTNNLTANYERLKPEEAKQRKDFALYIIGKSKELSDQKNYKFTALELPIHKSLHSKPVIYDYRTSFNAQLKDLSREKGFPIFYLENYIDEMEGLNRWNDTGHMSVLGRYTYEKYYVDALAKFINGEEGGVYGDISLAPVSTQSEPQE